MTEKSTEALLEANRKGEPARAHDEPIKNKAEEAENKAPQKEPVTKAPDVKPDPRPDPIADKLERLEKQLKDTKTWGNKANEDKQHLLKKLHALAEEGHVDEADLKDYTLDDKDALATFWQTVESHIKGYTDAFNTPDPQNYLSAFRAQLRDIALHDKDRFAEIEKDLRSMPQDAWIRYVMDTGKAYWDDYMKHLEGKSEKEAFLDLRKEYAKLKDKLDATPQTRPLLNGSGRSTADETTPTISTEHLLDRFRQQAIRR